ncbi:MAG: OB-fold nucleic acid binding domain-containing protein [Acidobacteria bacterium]|nr:OB-fold nucleic acid binding domain-containing protein [Acidobacteriota bacterium]
MTKRARVVLSTCVIFLAITLTGCPPRKSIADIMRDPSRYVNEEVTIAGRVTRSFGALGRGIFEVDDGTGRMWVLSEQYGVPGQGAKVAVTGRVIQGITFAGQNFATVLRETRRRT